MEKDAVEIKIRFNKIWLERAIWIVVVLILGVLVFYNPFASFRCEKDISEITSAPVVETEEPEPEVEEEPVVEEEPEPEPEPEAEAGQELSGEATLIIDTIKLDADKKKVESITVKIDNQKKIFTPLVYVYWYDKSSPEAVKLFPNGGKIGFVGPIPLGRISVKKLDTELVNHMLRTDDTKKEFFKIELYDKSGKVLLDTKTKSIATD